MPSSYFQTFLLKFFIFFLILLIFSSFTKAEKDDSCCRKASGSCRKACDQISLPDIAANPILKEKSLKTLYKFCTVQLNQFWECMNVTLKEIQKGEDWFGRRCCQLPRTARCRKACVTATTRQDLFNGCRQSDEIIFFECLNRQENGEKCCANARSNDCFEACKSVFQTMLTPNREVRKAVKDSCGVTSPKVLSCIKTFMKVTPVTNAFKFLHCCDHSDTHECIEGCKEVLKSKNIIQEIIDELQEKGCGPPLPDNKLWQCFLHTGSPVKISSSFSSVSRIDQMGIDSAKLHCCNKASSTACRKFCIKTFSDEYAVSWKDFNRQCLSFAHEEELSQCLDDVDEPCELGCDGLSYCINFNNRPTELFRSCNTQADDAARYDVVLWEQQGYFILPGGIKILVKNVSKCSPDMWKAVACVLQIKPCHKQSHSNRICSEDCYNILTQCMDWSKMPVSHTPAFICSKLSSEKHSDSCISLKSYLEPSKNLYLEPKAKVTSPCKGNPCEPDEICFINRNCLFDKPCPPYFCKPGCKLGEASQYIIPYDSYVKIPFSMENKECQKVCSCTQEKTLVNCQVMPCVPFDHCWLGKRKIDHGSKFFLNCNLCSCFYGEIICNKKQCEEKSLDAKIFSSFTTLPCNCPLLYVPVCGRNGYSYPNFCLAKCSGLKDADFELGSCSARNVCDPNPCGEGFKCVPLKKVCLSLLEKPCKQYVCVDVTSTCTEIPRKLVCDTEQKEHYNLCSLVKAGKTLAYTGPCLTNCQNEGPVCGIDGETYTSQCSAMANFVLIDYQGSCIAVGLISDEPKAKCGPAVACNELPSSGCHAVTPPGACCPICAGALRLLFNRKQVDRALYALRGATTNSLTIRSILLSLERQIEIAECSLWGYLTIELDIFVAVVPRRVTQKTEIDYLQREICVKEAEKLMTLVQKASPKITSDLGLSSLTAASLIHVFVNSGFRTTTFIFIWFIIALNYLIS